jgi:tetratricopeptide (TPR) repeat protein
MFPLHRTMRPYERVLKVFLLALAFTPIIYYPGALFPYIFPKVLFIRLMVTAFWVGFAILYFLAPIGINQRLNRQRQPASKNPIAIAVFVFLCFAALSAVFAVSRSRAFWGDVERGEGIVSLLFYFGFFVAALLMFSEKDWRTFFGLTMISFSALFLDQLYFKLSGSSLLGSLATGEPMFLAGSLTGNPTFLAAFYLFVILAASMLLVGRQIPAEGAARLRELACRIGLGAAIVFAAIGIFLSTTRGAIAGLGLGIAAVFAFVAARRDMPRVWRRIGVSALALGMLFVTVFIATRHAAFWQRIPGLDDIARLSWQDTTLQTRLTAVLISANAMNPAKVGIGRTLVGWGQEQFGYVFQRFYEPRYLRFEALWFDRAHNKLLDVLVMNGALGFAAYALLWALVFRAILRREDRREAAALLFFGVSYFVQNVFAFDTVATYIPLFAFLAFVASGERSAAASPAPPPSPKRRSNVNALENIGIAAAGPFAVFTLVVLAVTYIAFRQMLAYVPAISRGRMDLVYQNFDRVITPYTYVQPELRVSLLQQLVTAVQRSDNPQAALQAARPLLMKAFSAAEEAVRREGWNSRAYSTIATTYEALGDLASAEAYWKKALELSPRRQELLYSLALNYARRGRGEEALALGRELVALDPDAARARIYHAVIVSLVEGSASFREATDAALAVFEGPVPFYPNVQDLHILRNLFNFYLTLFYQAKDDGRFLEAMERAKAFEERYEAAAKIAPGRSLEIQKGIDGFRERGWGAISLGK